VTNSQGQTGNFFATGGDGTVQGQLVGRTITMIVVRIVEAVAGGKKETANRKECSKYGQNQLNIHKNSLRYPTPVWRSSWTATIFLKNFLTP
jgi:hypothetical protein